MRRYRDLIQTILEYAECQGNGRPLPPPEVKDYSPAQVEYHVDLCLQAGFVKTSEAPGLILGLTLDRP